LTNINRGSKNKIGVSHDNLSKVGPQDLRNCPQYHSYTKDVVEVRTFVLTTTVPCDGDDRRIFLGLKFSILGFFWEEKFGKCFFGWLDLSGDFFGYSKQSEDLW